jgi:hypothetical protein
MFILKTNGKEYFFRAKWNWFTSSRRRWSINTCSSSLFFSGKSAFQYVSIKSSACVRRSSSAIKRSSSDRVNASVVDGFYSIKYKVE